MNTLKPRWYRRDLSALLLAAILLTCLGTGRLPCVFADDPNDCENSTLSNEPAVEPEALTAQHFAALKSHSPFLRSLDLSKTIVLTGVAQVDGELVATLFDRESKETRVVAQTANAQGWHLVDVQGDKNRLESMTAQIAVSGGEVISVRFDPTQNQVAQQAGGPQIQIPADQAEYIAEQARNFRQGIRGDGVRGPPSPELVQKLSQLNEQQRGVVIYQIRQLRDNGDSDEARKKAILQIADRALQQRR